MIARLRGILDSMGEDWAIIDVGGVGYLVYASGKTLSAIGSVGQNVSTLVETHVREDAITLYAFGTEQERDWFRLLFTVQGVGAKVALGLLTALTPDQIGLAIASGDKAALTRAPGVGPKLAARLATELKDKAARLGMGTGASSSSNSTASVSDASVRVSDHGADAVSALVNLGYGRSDAFEAVGRASAALGKEADVNALISAALKELGKNAFS